MTYWDYIKAKNNLSKHGFHVEGGTLYRQGLSMKGIIDQFDSPIRLAYLPQITQQIEKARDWFNQAIQDQQYQGEYHYAYCTKSAHFRFILETALASNVHLEVSSPMDLILIEKLYEADQLSMDTLILNNGFKSKPYLQKIADLIESDKINMLPILDNEEEWNALQHLINRKFNVGIRIAVNDGNPQGIAHGRLGFQSTDVLHFVKNKLLPNPKASLKMLHFFVDSGITNTDAYWNNLERILQLYTQLKKHCPSLNALNLGGGFPIAHQLDFDYDYEDMVNQILQRIAIYCNQHQIPHPDIYTEFGTFTVGESGSFLFEVIGQKKHTSLADWYFIDNGFLSTIPDNWGAEQAFIILPLNHWDKPIKAVHLGGISCDYSDFYHQPKQKHQLILPDIDQLDEPLYLGIFNVGAYQEALSGFGGIKHCLLPSPKVILVDKDKKDQFNFRSFSNVQDAENMLKTLGF